MIIGIVTDVTAGGTFLTWTLHYLAGHDSYFHAIKGSWCKLTSSPLTKINAHNFNCNQPNGIHNFNIILNELLNTGTDTFHSVYFHQFNNNKDYNVDLNHLIKINDDLNQKDTKLAIDKLQENSDKVILLRIKLDDALYYCKYEDRNLGYKLHNEHEKYDNHDDKHQDFLEFYFKESLEKWVKLGLTNNIWDRREFLALNIRPYESHISIMPNFDLSKKHYLIDGLDLATNLNYFITDLFDFLDLSIDSSRLDSWSKTYNNWKKKVACRVLFVRYFDDIIKYIISGYYMDLNRFNLDIVQEAAIQHILLYKHSLSIKTWQLEKFNNTKQINALLEPNTYHEVKDIYGVRK